MCPVDSLDKMDADLAVLFEGLENTPPVPPRPLIIVNASSPEPSEVLVGRLFEGNSAAPKRIRTEEEEDMIFGEYDAPMLETKEFNADEKPIQYVHDPSEHAPLEFDDDEEEEEEAPPRYVPNSSEYEAPEAPEEEEDEEEGGGGGKKKELKSMRDGKKRSPVERTNHPEFYRAVRNIIAKISKIKKINPLLLHTNAVRISDVYEGNVLRENMDESFLNF